MVFVRVKEEDFDEASQHLAVASARLMQISRGEKSGTIIAFSSQEGSAPPDGPQYREASPSQKRTLLEAFIATTGYVRKYARWLLNHADEVQQTHGRSQLRSRQEITLPIETARGKMV